MYLRITRSIAQHSSLQPTNQSVVVVEEVVVEEVVMEEVVMVEWGK